MNKIKIIAQAALFFALMTVLTGVLYPLLITYMSRLLFYEKSLGSLLKEKDYENIIGSTLIAQNFTKSEYFWARPSASNFNAIPSQASNLGPTSQNLKDLIFARRQSLSLAHDTNFMNVPESLLTSSGSGLDPHITLLALDFQKSRVLKARKLNQEQEKQLQEIINKNLEQPWFRAQKEPHINVLLLNLALDQSFGKIGQ